MKKFQADLDKLNNNGLTWDKRLKDSENKLEQ